MSEHVTIHTQIVKTTTQTVKAEFTAPGSGGDLTLADLREALESAAHMPDDAIVTVYARGAWYPPTSLLIEQRDQDVVKDSTST